ncbi:MAG: NADH-quinone oxidoreductase subunit D [Candidatus Hydrogenedentota bacterium]
MSEFIIEGTTLFKGPQHPSTHGVFQLKLKTDGEIVIDLDPVIGYLHRCFEKHCENINYTQVIPYTDRLDYVASMNNNWGYCLCVEKLAGIEVPKRAEFIRVIVGELNRIASHLVAFGTYGMDIGAFTPFLYAFREREFILDLFEELCGARLTYNFVRIGGVSYDLPPGWLQKCLEFLDYFLPFIDEYNNLLSYNKIFIKRTARVGILSKELAIDYNVTGPNLRACGIDWDLRRDEPFSVYKELEFNVCTGKDGIGVCGDSWNRYFVRMLEMAESVKIIKQALDMIPDGPVMSKFNPLAFKPPAGEAYARCETPRGEIGFFIMSNGSDKPYRVKVKSPCFSAISSIPAFSKGLMIADIVAVIGSLDFVMGEVDR